MRIPASCRGCAGRNRPRVQHWRSTRCCMTRCRARRTESNCQVGNRRRARLPRCGLITAPWVVRHVQPNADHATARPHRCARHAGATATATVCGQQINRLPPDQTSARAWPPSGGQARMSAPSIQPKLQNRALTARKQRFLTAVHTIARKTTVPASAAHLGLSCARPADSCRPCIVPHPVCRFRIPPMVSALLDLPKSSGKCNSFCCVTLLPMAR